jgi:hypothetical protein
MDDDGLESEVLSKVGTDRRTFVKRLVVGSAFAIPLVASFDVDSLTLSKAEALSPSV